MRRRSCAQRGPERGAGIVRCVGLPGVSAASAPAALAPSTATPNEDGKLVACRSAGAAGQARPRPASPRRGQLSLARRARRAVERHTVKVEGSFVTGIGATTTYHRLQARALHRVLQNEGVRHGHGVTGHLQLLGDEGENRTEPLSRTRAGGGRVKGAAVATSPRRNTARRCCRWAASIT